MVHNQSDHGCLEGSASNFMVVLKEVLQEVVHNQSDHGCLEGSASNFMVVLKEVLPTSQSKRSFLVENVTMVHNRRDHF